MLNSLEKWLAVALIALSFFHVGQVAVAMATTSLSTDEFGTVGTFSSKGPIRVLTDYRAPKNHIFFNLLNAVLPGRESWNPARVRSLAILATLFTAIGIVAYAVARGQWLEGAAVLALWTFAPEMLTLSMEARGYGFLGLFALLGAIAVAEYLRTGRRRWLVTLVAASVLGTYTVPSFLILAAPMLLLLWLARRDRETFIAGGIAAGLTLLLYTPVLGQVAAAFTGFHEGREEAEFGTIASLFRAVRLYLFPSANWQAAALLGALLLAPFVFVRDRTPRERAGLCLVTAAGAIYLGTLLVLRTPPLRLAACGLLPVALSGIFALGVAARTRLPSRGSCAVFLIIGSALLLKAGREIWTFDFLPTENWTLAARAITAAFPPTVKVECGRYAKYLKQTLPDAEARRADYDAKEFTAGRLIVADASNKWAEGRQFFPPAGLAGVREWRIPGRIRDFVLNFRLPENARMGKVFAEGESVKPGKTTVEIKPESGERALVILLSRPLSESEFSVESPGAFLAGNGLVIPLASGPLKLTLRSRDANLTVVTSWFTQ